jgi:toxin ParE1/3/4
MNRRIIVLPEAEADLSEQYAWFLTEVNEDVADRFLAAFDATARLAFEHPESGAERSFLDPRLHTLRMLTLHDFGRHLLFYRPTEQGIDIVRVLHSARNVEAMLRDQPEL